MDPRREGERGMREDREIWKSQDSKDSSSGNFGGQNISSSISKNSDMIGMKDRRFTILHGKVPFISHELSPPVGQ